MNDVTFGRFTVRVTCCHVVTYFVAGVLALTLLDYKTLFQSEGFSSLMLPTSSKWVAAGPALQVVRGVVFALALYPFRRSLSARSRRLAEALGAVGGSGHPVHCGTCAGVDRGDDLHRRFPWPASWLVCLRSFFRLLRSRPCSWRGSESLTGLGALSWAYW